MNLDPDPSPCPPGECPTEGTPWPCPICSGVHRFPVPALRKRIGDPVYRARILGMAREDHEAALNSTEIRVPKGNALIDGHAIIDPCTFITTERLTRDTIEFRKSLPPDIDCIVGISRSGLLPGSIIAYDFHVPLLTVSRQSGLNDPGHGGRMDGRERNAPSHILLIDDTVASGHEMTTCYPIVKERFPDAKITRAVIYARPSAIHAVDIFAAIYDGYHHLEWNFANAGFGSLGCWDMDGLICRDFTPEECADDATYRKTMEAITPLYLPRRLPVPMIVTARPESTRDITLDWLSRYGVRVDRLIMRDFEPDPAKGWTRSIAEYKAGHYAQSACMTFIESEPEQAKIIAEITGRDVLCPAMGRLIPAKAKEPPWKQLQVLVDECPHRGDVIRIRSGCQCEIRRCAIGKGPMPGKEEEVSNSDCLECKRQSKAG